MKPYNLISAYQGAKALNSLEKDIPQKYKVLKGHEIASLQSFCNDMAAQGCTFPDFDGYFLGYSIAQIGKEFDLLRFGTNFLLNVELKSHQFDVGDYSKILKQMRRNFYYLQALNCPLKILTYVEGKGYYEYNDSTDLLNSVAADEMARILKEQEVDKTVDPDQIFAPSQYLVSPFNSTDRFIKGEYFLTSNQEEIKQEALDKLRKGAIQFFCISANAGTGKTLLIYDIAKTLIADGENVTIIHGGNLNQGQECLKAKYSWNILPVKDIHDFLQQEAFDGNATVIVDEAQRLREKQLQELILKASNANVPVFFSYDPRQYLNNGEGRDIAEYFKENFPQLDVIEKHLTDRIRTNRKIASFINNLLAVGSSTSDLDYEHVSVEYIEDMPMLSAYIKFLRADGWTPITFTASMYNQDPYDDLARISDIKAHSVIGQEFSKVVFVMDKNFRYNERNRLAARRGQYNGYGMMYQIVTRAINDLKIIVFQNTDLYLRLLDIKSMGSK